MRSDDGHDPIDPALLEAELARPLEPELRGGAVLEPSPGFADRVLAAQKAPVAQRRRPWLLGVVAAAALLVFAVLALKSGADRGELLATERTSVTLGARGVAVAEAGAALHWRVTRGRAEVEQRAGNVFYRVEHGGPFVVHTAAGDVEVLGTCFRVEVENMQIGKQGIIGAGVGAALAATVVVSVYEGRVLYANEQGRVTLAAGERARATSASAPSSLGVAETGSARAEAAQASAAELSREALVERAEAQARELVALKAKVQALESVEGSAGGAQGRANDKSYFAPTKEELAQLVKECRLKWDQPRLGATASTLSAEDAAQEGLSEDERQAINKVNAEFNAHDVSELRRLYAEVTGDASGAETLTPSALVEEIEEKSPRADVKAVFQRLARERAGLQAPPADPRAGSPVERLMRLQTSSGDRFERELGAAIGPDLARQLREKHSGWGSRHASSYGCPDEK